MAKATNKIENQPPAFETVVIEIPVADLRQNVHLPEYMNFRLIGHRSSRSMQEALKRVTDALHQSHVVMRSGRHVDNPTDAIRWILDQIAEQVEQESARRNGSE